MTPTNLYYHSEKLYQDCLYNDISKDLNRPLRIVQVAPAVYPIPPQDYGGTELVIYELIESLIKKGCKVYLYAPEGSKTSATLIPYKSSMEGNSIEIMKYVTDTLPNNIDIFHYHTHPSFISSKCIAIPCVCTIHGPIEAVTRNPVYVSKKALQLFGGNRGYYVYNGIDLNRYEFSKEKKDYLLFLGRIDREKGTHNAIEVAEKTNHKLLIAGPIHDHHYYKSHIESKIKNNPNIYYVGPVSGKKKQALIKNAKCVLFPITWEEPFGLVMTETLACGTPILALERGSVPEVLGGFPELICRTTDEMIQKVNSGIFPDPHAIRKYIQYNFSASIMADRYIEIYKKLIEEQYTKPADKLESLSKNKPQEEQVYLKTNMNSINFITKKHLRILQIAPDVFPIPPANYGGIERIVYDLTEELVKRGHEVFLYANKGSVSSATIIPYQHNEVNSAKISEFLVETLPDNIDLIHDHTHASVADKLRLPIPTVSTIHDSRPNTAKNPIYLCKRALQTVGQNQGFYVYNGINPTDYEFCDTKEDYLLFLGVLNWHKGINYAIDVAEETKQKLIIAGPIFHPDYFEKYIKPRILANSNIQYVGEVGGKVRQDLLKHSKCMLFPTSWEEPFGLVMVEAMACGTPVIAFSNGAVSEVLHGFPDLICSSADEMANKVLNLSFPSPFMLHQYVMDNFTSEIMTNHYIEVYNKVLGG